MKNEEKDSKIIDRGSDWGLNLDFPYISPMGRKMILDGFEQRDALGILCNFSNEYGLHFLLNNIDPLLKQGMYEETLFQVFIGCRGNWSHMTLSTLRYLFGLANKQRLLNAGDTLPHDGPFTLYRGVCGNGKKRRIRGISWTASFDRAQWFAERFSDLYPNPAVYCIQISKKHVYVYTNEREEEEFLCDIRKHMKIKKVWP